MAETKTIVPFPCFNYRIYLIFSDDLVETADKLADQGKLARNHNIDETTDGFTVRMPNQSYTFIVLRRTATPAQLSHECYHALCNMFRWIGATHEEEIFAYFIGYLVGVATNDQKKAQKVLDKSKQV